MNKTLSAATMMQDFPGGTADTDFSFTITGKLADGTPFAASGTAVGASMDFDLQPGSYVGQVSKLGVSSQPSAELVIDVPTAVSLSVPDAAQAAVFA